MSKIHLAIKCLEENRVLFGNPKTAPEKHNLYIGLREMAESLRMIEAYLANLQPR